METGVAFQIWSPERGRGGLREAPRGRGCCKLALATSRGMRPLIAHCHVGLGKIYRRTGKRDQVGDQLAAATTMYRDMGMAFWLRQAETEFA